MDFEVGFDFWECCPELVKLVNIYIYIYIFRCWGLPYPWVISSRPKPDCYGFYSELFFETVFGPSLWLNF